MPERAGRVVTTIACATGVVVSAVVAGCVTEGDRRPRVSQEDIRSLEERQRAFEVERAANLAKAEQMYNNDVPRLYTRYRQSQGDHRAERLVQLITKLEEIRSLAPKLPNVRIDLSYLYLESGLHAQAQQALIEEAEISPADPRPSHNLGSLYLERGWPDEAARHFRRALERDPNYLPAMRGVVQIADLDRISDPDLLALVRRALMLERDPAWEAYLRRQQLRIEQQLAERRPMP